MWACPVCNVADDAIVVRGRILQHRDPKDGQLCDASGRRTTWTPDDVDPSRSESIRTVSGGAPGLGKRR